MERSRPKLSDARFWMFQSRVRRAIERIKMTGWEIETRTHPNGSNEHSLISTSGSCFQRDGIFVDGGSELEYEEMEEERQIEYDTAQRLSDLINARNRRHFMNLFRKEKF